MKTASRSQKRLKFLARFITKGLRLRTRAFIPFGILLLWLASRESLSYWGLIFVGAGIALRLWASGHLRKGDLTPTTSGPYAYCRNPLYLGSGIMGLGLIIMAYSTWLLVIAAILYLVFHHITIRYEESRLAKRYKEPYREYCRNVPRLLPRLFPWDGAQTSRFSLVRLKANQEHIRALVLLCFVAAVIAISLYSR